jgi:hypothetical protein
MRENPKVKAAQNQEKLYEKKIKKFVETAAL